MPPLCFTQICICFNVESKRVLNTEFSSVESLNERRNITTIHPKLMYYPRS